ncbi:hypothetical protein J3E68DRAFT_105411 [Trichoderma sp. SZMC 28012]
METVNSQISASYQSVTDIKHPIGPYRNGPSRRRRRPRKSRPGQRLDLSQPNASLKSRKRQKGQNTDAPTKKPSVLEFSIDGLYPNDDVIYPAPPDLSRYQISAQRLPADIISPRARDANHNGLSSIEENERLFSPQEDNKCEKHERTPHVPPDDWEQNIRSEGPHQESNIRDHREIRNLPYKDDRGRRALLQRSNLLFLISSPVLCDPPSLTVVQPVPEWSKPSLENPLSQVISKTKPPVHSTKLNT